MIEFVRTVEAEIALTTANDEESGAAAQSRLVLVVVGLLGFVLAGLFSGRQVAVTLAGAPPFGALTGLVGGFRSRGW